MDFKAYGSTCTVTEDSITVTASNKFAEKAIGAKQRTIMFNDIFYLAIVKGNLFVNHRIIIGDKLGKTVIYIVPWRNNFDKAEMLYNMIYLKTKPLGNLTEDKPRVWRNDQ